MVWYGVIAEMNVMLQKLFTYKILAVLLALTYSPALWAQAEFKIATIDVLMREITWISEAEMLQ